jgi:hypothetical protein
MYKLIALEELVRTGGSYINNFFGPYWFGPNEGLVRVFGSWFNLEFEDQKKRFITQCNLPKAEHLNPLISLFCEMTDEWIMDYAVLIGHQGGVFMNFLKTIIAHITDCQVQYDAQVLAQHSERLAVQSVLLRMLQKIVLIDAVSMNLSIPDALRHAISTGLSIEGIDTHSCVPYDSYRVSHRRSC